MTEMTSQSDAAMAAAAARLAKAEMTLADAVQRTDALQAEVAQVRGRIDAVEQRRAAIRADLESGNLSDKEAGGLLSLASDDERDLRVLLSEATRAVADAEPVAERRLVDAARGDLARAQTEAKLDAVRLHIEAAEAALLDGLRAAEPLLRALGRPPHVRQIWNPTHETQRAVGYNQLPARRGVPA